MRIATLTLVLLVLVSAAACRKPEPAGQRYPLAGEVVSVRADHAEITVRHEEVKGFMDAMTMPFAIKDKAQLQGLVPGDRITATLVVTAEESYLTGITKTGSAPPAR